MSNLNVSIERNESKLSPVLTCIQGISHDGTVSARLRFSNVCHVDLSRRLHFSGILSEKDQTLCISLLDRIIESYLKVEEPPTSTQNSLISTCKSLLNQLSPEFLSFLKHGCERICGQRFFTSLLLDLENIVDYNSISNIRQIKKMSGFSGFVLAMIVLYACENEYRERILSMEENLRNKFGDTRYSEQLTLYLWPIDFSFLDDDSPGEDLQSEHSALLDAVRSINPDTKVQMCRDSLLWSRDVIAWLDEGFELYLKADNETGYKFGDGSLNEGGNIITGTAENNFILIAQSALPDIMTEIYIRGELFQRNIRLYKLPDGFLWARDPLSRKDFILDSIHIDTVINFVPPHFSSDNRGKLLIDPLYYTMIKNCPEFDKFLKEQSIRDKDIVIVDEKERYLNLPNFSILQSNDGTGRLLINKDKGLTLPRLNLKPELVVKPRMEITRLSSEYGCIRCATNMLPESLISSGCPVTIIISDTFPLETKEKLLEQFGIEKVSDYLSNLFVKNLYVMPGPDACKWEFDDFSNSAYLFVPGSIMDNPEECAGMVGKCLSELRCKLESRLGIFRALAS